MLDRDGFAAATVERIAAEAGTSKGVVIYHFGSKEAIFEAVVAMLYGRGAEVMDEKLRVVSGHRERLHIYLDSNLRFIAEHVSHVNAVHRILENTRMPDLPDGVAPLRDLLATGQAAGAFGEFDPQIVALTIRAAVDQASFSFTAHPGFDIDHYVTQTVQLFDRATAAQKLHP